jgi:hypothetical protein
MDKKEEKKITDILIDIQAKMQKVVTAVYMVSDLIKKTDPIRQNMRFLSVKILARVSNITTASSSKARKEITEAQSLIEQLLGLLKVSVSVGFVSDMNFKLITETLIFIKDDLNKKYASLTEESTLSKNFHNRAIEEFTLPDNLFLKDLSKGKKDIKKTQEMSYKTEKTQSGQYTAPKPTKQRVVSQGNKTDRDEKVYNIVSQEGEVSVSDVADKFPEVSEKTIQRILVKLVDTGRLSKTGERRWSRYSIAK